MDLKILTIVLNFAFLISEQTRNKIPDWFFNPPQDSEKYYSTGFGKIKLEAVLKSIANLEISYKSISEGRNQSFNIDSINNYESISTSISGGTLVKKLTNGSFSIEIRSEDFLVESGPSNNSEIRASFDKIFHLKYSSGNNEYAFVQFFFKERGYSHESKVFDNFEALFQNMDETILMHKLKSHGFMFDYFQDDEGLYYVLLSVNKL